MWIHLCSCTQIPSPSWLNSTIPGRKSNFLPSHSSCRCDRPGQRLRHIRSHRRSVDAAVAIVSKVSLRKVWEGGHEWSSVFIWIWKRVVCTFIFVCLWRRKGSWCGTCMFPSPFPSEDGIFRESSSVLSYVSLFQCFQTRGSKCWWFLFGSKSGIL